MTEIADSSEVFATLSDEMQEAIADLGWREPMPVQAKVLPLSVPDAPTMVTNATVSMS